MGVDGQAVLGVGLLDEPPLPEAEEVVLAHNAQDPLVIDDQSFAVQLGRHPAVSVDGLGQRQALDMVPKIDIWIRRGSQPSPTVPGGTWQRESAAGASQCKRKAAVSRLGKSSHHLPDPFSPARGGRTSRRTRAFFKRAISIACWPAMRSNSAIFASEV